MYWVESRLFFLWDILVVVITVAKETKFFLSTTYFSYTLFDFSFLTCRLGLNQNSFFNFILISDIHASETCKAYLNHE